MDAIRRYGGVTMRPTHQQQVLEHLKNGNTLTQADAIHLFNCYRLSGVILQLRQLGYDIVTHKVKNAAKNGTYASYELQGE